MTEFEKEKASIAAFAMEVLEEGGTSLIYLDDLHSMYNSWRLVSKMPPTKLSVRSFGRALPNKYERRFMNRGRNGRGPARALLGVAVRH